MGKQKRQELTEPEQTEELAPEPAEPEPEEEYATTAPESQWSPAEMLKHAAMLIQDISGSAPEHWQAEAAQFRRHYERWARPQ